MLHGQGAGSGPAGWRLSRANVARYSHDSHGDGSLGASPNMMPLMAGLIAGAMRALRFAQGVGRALGPAGPAVSGRSDVDLADMIRRGLQACEGACKPDPRGARARQAVALASTAAA